MALFTYMSGAASAAQLVTLSAQFRPNRLGAPTTIEFGIDVSSSTPGAVPSPVTDVDLSLPAGLGLATSTLGLAVCQPATLLRRGPDGCPANARVGTGSAQGKLTSEGEVITEAATVYAFLGPRLNEDEQVLFYVAGENPVSAELVFSGRLLPSPSARFGGHLDTAIPIVPAWQDGPDIAVTSFSSTLGPLGLTYYRHIHGGFVPFHPKGIGVPLRCPLGGFPFAARLTFLDGSEVMSRTAVPCPLRRDARPSNPTGGRLRRQLGASSSLLG
jgi:hypothetical protein